MDDASIGASINLKECLELDFSNRQKPLNFSERTGHVLPNENNLLQMYPDDFEIFANENYMIINKNKTKVMTFKKTRKIGFSLRSVFYRQ